MLEKSMLLSLRLEYEWLEMVRSEVLYDNLGTAEIFEDRRSWEEKYWDLKVEGCLESISAQAENKRGKQSRAAA